MFTMSDPWGSLNGRAALLHRRFCVFFGFFNICVSFELELLLKRCHSDLFSVFFDIPLSRSSYSEQPTACPSEQELRILSECTATPVPFVAPGCLHRKSYHEGDIIGNMRCLIYSSLDMLQQFLEHGGNRVLADRVVGPILCADEREKNMEAPSPAKRYIFVICCLHQSSMVDPS